MSETHLIPNKRLQGHLGRLTPEQEQKLATFKVNLEQAGLYTPGNDSTPPSHDDATLLRFLRARRFDPAKGQKQFADTVAWRKKYDVDNLFANFEEEEFEAARRFYPMWTGRRDKLGVPVYVYRIGALTSDVQKKINGVPAQRRYERIISLYEVMLRLVAPLCSTLPRECAPTPVSQVTSIIDLGGTSFRQLLLLRAHLQEASTLANANYPETLGPTLVINCPSFFETVWGWIKGWFDENTRDKIYILGHQPGKTIMTLVDPQNVPKEYGGELDWQFGDDPALDEDAKKALGGNFPRGPVIFVDGKVTRPKEYKGTASDGQHARGETPAEVPAEAAAEATAEAVKPEAHENGQANGEVIANGDAPK